MAKKQDAPHAAPAPAAQQQPPVMVAKEVALEKIPEGGELQEGTLDEMFMEDAGAGMRGMSANDFAIPFITILQKGSPQVSRANAKCIKGAEQGMIMNTVTQELYGGETGVLFVPCGYSKSAVEWTSRDSGGGLVAHHKEGDPFLKKCQRDERGRLVVPENGNIVVDTAYHFGLLLHDDASPEWAVISMYSTQLKKSRMWNTTMRRIMIKGPNGVFNPPSYSHQYRMTTMGETKDTYDWFGWKVVSEGRVDDIEIYKMAREFSKQVESGDVRISAPPQEFEGSDDVPF